jgi:hypothetical protein
LGAKTADGLVGAGDYLQRDGFAPGNFSHRWVALCGNLVPEDLHQRIDRPNLKHRWARGANTGFL